jgi:hypothetical protein
LLKTEACTVQVKAILLRFRLSPLADSAKLPENERSFAENQAVALKNEANLLNFPAGRSSTLSKVA